MIPSCNYKHPFDVNDPFNILGCRFCRPENWTEEEKNRRAQAHKEIRENKTKLTIINEVGDA